MSELFALIDMDSMQLALLCFVVFIAAVIRGFSGFGFGAVVMTAGSLFMRPLDLVPISLILEIAATAHMLPSIWRRIDWRAVGWITAGSIVTVPFAQLLLASLPVMTTRLVTCIGVLVATLLLMVGYTFVTQKHKTVYFSVGLISGAMNGIAAIGGIVCTLVMLSMSASPAVVRATTSMYLMAGDIGAIGLGYAADTGVFTTTAWWRVLALLPALFAGVWLGSRQFANTSPESWRRIAIRLVLFLAITGIVRVVYDVIVGVETV